MNKTLTVIVMCLAILGSGGANGQAKKPAGTAKKIYCWDQGGKQVCGDALPPEATGAARKEINARTGLTTRELGRVLSDDERQDQAQEQTTQAHAKAMQEDRARRGQALAASYDNVEGVKQGYDQRIELAKRQAESTMSSIEQTMPHLLRLLRAAGEAELKQEKVTAKQSAEILKVKKDILDMQKHAKMQAGDVLRIQKERDEAMALYLEVTQAAVQAPDP